MRRVLVGFLALAMMGLTPAAGAEGDVHMTGVLDGAPFEIRVPDTWNGTLLVYAHGYRDKADHPGESARPSGDAVDSAPGGDAAEEALLAQGYALAGSLYADDGWAVREGINGTRGVTEFFRAHVGIPDMTILWGFSLGSIITFETAEKAWARHLFDGYIPGCAVGAGSTRAWDGALALALAYDAAFGWPESWGEPWDVRNDLDFDTEVLPVIGAQFADPANIPLFEFVRAASTLPAADLYPSAAGGGWLLTDMFFSTEARAELERRAGGNPAWNRDTVYAVGATDRAILNAIGLDDTAIDSMLATMNDAKVVTSRGARKYLRRFANYTGRPSAPVLTVHTTVDGLVPSTHETVYAADVAAAGFGDRLVQVFTDTYPDGTSSGHCTFTPEQLGAVVLAMQTWIATGIPPDGAFFPEALGFVPGFDPGPWPFPL
ncbi:MAG: hypothetical protein ACE5E8_05655 [Acidimicrobiia bacterium]